MKLRLQHQPVVQLELQTTPSELHLLRKSLGRFCTKDLQRIGMTEQEQEIFRKFYFDLSEIDTVISA